MYFLPYMKWNEEIWTNTSRFDIFLWIEKKNYDNLHNSCFVLLSRYIVNSVDFAVFLFSSHSAWVITFHVSLLLSMSYIDVDCIQCVTFSNPYSAALLRSYFDILLHPHCRLHRKSGQSKASILLVSKYLEEPERLSGEALVFVYDKFLVFWVLVPRKLSFLPFL